MTSETKLLIVIHRTELDYHEHVTAFSVVNLHSEETLSGVKVRANCGGEAI